MLFPPPLTGMGMQAAVPEQFCAVKRVSGIHLISQSLL